jgi:hypothetical protein
MRVKPSSEQELEDRLTVRSAGAVHGPVDEPPRVDGKIAVHWPCRGRVSSQYTPGYFRDSQGCQRAVTERLELRP